MKKNVEFTWSHTYPPIDLYIETKNFEDVGGYVIVTDYS